MEKFFLKSKTILGVIVTMLPTLLPALGISFGAEDAQLISNTGDALIQVGGAMLAVYGRFVAKHDIGLT